VDHRQHSRESAVTEPDADLPTPPAPGQPGINRYGRRGALTPELQDQIVRVVRAGNYLKVAAQFCGIGESTLRLWLSKGRKAAALRDAGGTVPEEDQRYLAFLEAVTQSESAAEVAAVTHWRSAFADDWRAARDYLRYSQPDRWSPVTRVSVTPEEAERRIEDATERILTSVGVDTGTYGGDLLLAGDLDPDTAGLDGGPLPGLSGEDEEDGWGDEEP
jgi:hypothetical protein